MALDTLPTDFLVPTRDQVRDQGLRDTRFRVPSADTSPSTQPFIEASNIADVTAPIYSDAIKATKSGQIQTAVGSDLDAWGRRLGGTLPTNPLARRGVTKSSGFVFGGIALGGANINANTELKDPRTQQKFVTLVTNVYQDQQNVAIQSVAGGPVTNLPAGTKLQYTTPPPGVSQQVTVFAQADGSGLNGGAPSEGDDDYRRRLLLATSEPPGAGNEAQMIQAVQGIADLAVQVAVAWPAVFGPGTVAIGFLVPPASLGASRLPNGAQIAEAEAALVSAFPSEDGFVVASGAEQGVRVRLLVTWPDTVTGWADATPWPPNVVDPVHVTAGTVSSATFASSSSFPAPAAGQSVAFYDTVTRTFRLKRLLTVSGGGPYTVTFDMTTLNASDPSYVPVANQVVSPWSANMASLVAPVLTYFDAQGPGEMYASFSDPGRRQRRFPAPEPGFFPSRIENRMLAGLDPFVEDVVLYEPTPPFATTVGTPGTLFWVHRLSDLGVYAQ
jgi:uncharacterized phage protein gp47/JayE